MRLVLAAILMLATPAIAGDFGMADRGYLSRACGLDLDDDSVYGEAADCSTLCNDASGSVIVAEDVDGDAVDEAQIYVHASGTDDGTCGGPTGTDACATITYALENRLNTETGEDIICVVGSINEAVQLTDQDGDAGTKTRNAAGWEKYNHTLPTNPLMIVGADRDGDGEYPPYDTDDTAIIEGGTPVDHKIAFKFHSGGGNIDNDNIEIAHLTIKDHCTHDTITDANEGCGAFDTDNNLDPYVSDYVYIHDIYIDGVNKGHPGGSGAIWLYSLWSWESSNHVLENILATEVSGYGMRGSGGTTNDYVMVRNVTANWYGCGSSGESNECPLLASPCVGVDDPYDCCAGVGNGCNNTAGDGAAGIKVWGRFDNFEFLNNVWDTDQELWNSGSTGAVAIDTCVINAWIRNNLFIDWKVSLQVQGGLSGACGQPRNADEIWFDSNESVLRNAEYDTIGSLNLWGQNDTTYYTEDVYYINNIFRDESETYNQRICFLASSDSPAAGSDPSGSTITFANNTCQSDDWDEIYNYYAFNVDTQADDQHHAYVVKNNIFAGGAADDHLFGIEEDISIDSDYNIFEDNGSPFAFHWKGSTYATLALFSADSGTDTNSKGDGQNACDVTFLSSTDLHLDTSDTCAQEAGTTTGDGMNATFTNDIDDDTRPQSTNWDIGADEFASGYDPVGSCCTLTVCTDVTESTCTGGGGVWNGAGTDCEQAECEPPVIPVSGFAEGVTLSGVRKQ